MAETPKTVADIMTHEVVTVLEEENLLDIAKGLDRYGFRHLPVVDGETLVGLVSQRDLLGASVSSLVPSATTEAIEHQLEENVFVARVMQRDVATVTPETSLIEAAKTMRDHKRGCLPVVEGENKKLLGIITDSDFLNLAIALLEAQ